MTSKKAQTITLRALATPLATASATLVAAALGIGAAQAQTPPPCTSPESKQFDFWVGDWEAHFTQNGKPARSRNSITKILDGCVIFEDFRGHPDSPLNGLSHSVYDRQAGKWKQTWVDNSASYLDFVGEFKDGRMVLSRTGSKDGKTFLQRMVWFDIQPDRFAWHWERSDDGGKTWQVNWKIDYRRMK